MEFIAGDKWQALWHVQNHQFEDHPVGSTGIGRKTITLASVLDLKGMLIGSKTGFCNFIKIDFNKDTKRKRNSEKF